MLNNNISMIMLKILKCFIKQENKRLRLLEIEKMRELVKYNFKLNLINEQEKKTNNVVKNIKLSNNNEIKEFKPNRNRLQTI